MRKTGQATVVRLLIVIMLFTVFGTSVSADTIIRDEGEAEFMPRKLVLPYGFYSEFNGWFLGAAGGVSGMGQRQLTIAGTAAVSTEDAKLFYFIVKDLQVPGMERLFLDLSAGVTRYLDLRAFVPGNPMFEDEIAGSNDSSEDNYLQGPGWDSFSDLTFRYVLPLGHGRKGPVHIYTLKEGLLSSGASGGESWNPLESGRTFLEVKHFYRSSRFEEVGGKLGFRTNGLEFSLKHDNRDFPNNAEKGHLLKLKVSRDFGLFDSSDTWTVMEAEASKYFSLGRSRLFRQQVLALNIWTVDTTTWKERESGKGREVFHRPPYYRGATLGGFNRMRAYPFYRFNDRSAIYYGAELRVIPIGSPAGARLWPLKYLDIDWWQLVAIGELGRVAETWSVNELHSKMKWDLGAGLRAMMSKAVVRLDFVFNDESFGMWVMAGHPF